MTTPALHGTVGKISLLERAGLRHGFTTRAHGNLAARALESPEGKARLTALGAEIGFDPTLLVSCEQVHGSTVAVAHLCEDCGPGRRIPHTDGLITSEPWPLLITHADCFPVIVFEPRERMVALVHCGWRGTLAGILPRAVERLVRETGGRRSEMLAGIGPGICANCYEVGDEVVQAAFAAGLGGRISSDATMSTHRFDISGALVDQLLQGGIAAEHIEPAGRCSFEDRALASHRRDGDGFRNATVVVIDSAPSL